MRRLRLEPLEDRYLPATYGFPWLDPANLTVSFAKDGTRIVDQPSSLYSTLDKVAPTKVWQREVLRALQTWAANGNVNLGLVLDGGQAFGAAGRFQHDPRYGDIRVGARPLSGDVSAATVPPNPMAGGWQGDITFNSLA